MLGLIDEQEGRRATHLTNLLLRLTKGKCFWLGEEITEQDAVVERVANRIVGGGRSEEVGGNELGSLVEKLVERVLTVGSSGSPDNRLE